MKYRGECSCHCAEVEYEVQIPVALRWKKFCRECFNVALQRYGQLTVRWIQPKE